MRRFFVLAVISILFIGCSGSDDIETAQSEPDVINQDDATEEEPIIQANSLATITLDFNSTITTTSITMMAEVVDDGGGTIIDRGLVYSSMSNPDRFDIKISFGQGVGVFETSIEDLAPQRFYFVRAYVQNSKGYSYSEERRFRTRGLTDGGPYNPSEGLLALYNQGQVDSFGANNYSRIVGSLSIQLGSNIKDLTPLLSIQSLSELRISNLPNLKTLDGLQNVNEASGALTLLSLPELRDVKGLSGLTEVSFGINIGFVRKIKSFEGLENLLNSEYNSSITIRHCDALETLEGLQVEAFDLVRNLWLEANPSLSNAEALNGLPSLSYIRISGNSKLNNVDFLSNTTHVPDGITISFNRDLENIDGLSSLNSAGTYLYINNNPNLENVDSLSNLTFAHRLVLAENDQLSSISGLSQLTTVSEVLTINDNPMLTSLDGLESLESVGGLISIDSNETLSDLCALRPLLVAGGSSGGLLISGNLYNPSLVQILDGTCSI